MKPVADPARSLTLQRVANGFEAPLYLTAPARDPRLFVVEQPGRIRILRPTLNEAGASSSY